ncbi:TetR/AcrR family transcriptional regulator [Pseudoalteromonas sp. T1lg88]|uniref:TetR/AcrR family transcriptional regulator n=1 Tax=Pseudoalteromonas sp. T1lg88 TaxID=2077104 RepID=UPI000CF745B9|nr:TetR/AcrR family transcriptional regulator [Pseudoalteromonas sp. T1lg88]
MRLKDDNKKQAIYRAAMSVVTEQGLAGASMSKIGRAAGVSASTLYVYFENKEDMLNKLYVMLKEESANAYFGDVNNDTSVKSVFCQYIRNMFAFFIANPIMFSFQEQFKNSPNVSAQARARGLECDAPLHELYTRAVTEGLVVSYPKPVVHALTIAPITYLIQAHLNREIEVDAQLLEATVDMAWRAVSR